MARVGQMLIERLQELAGVEQIDYYPAGYNFEDGCLAPDIVVTLDLLRLNESAGLTECKLEADVAIHAGTGIVKSSVSSIDDLSPPCLLFDWNANLHHSSTVVGVESASSKYKLQSEDVAKQIAESLLKQFRQWRDENELQPKLPAAFYPAYHAPQEIPWYKTCQVEKLASWHGFMSHNETFYRLTLAAESDPADILAEIERQMQDSGWKTQQFTKKPPEEVYLRMRRQSTVFEIFAQRPGLMTRPPIVLENTVAPAAALKPVLYVSYIERMSPEEMAAAIEATLTADTPPETLVLFERRWSQVQGNKAMELLASHRPVTIQCWLALANLHHRQKRDEEAKVALIRANTLLWAEKNRDNFESQVKSLAKDLGMEKSLDKQPDVKLLQELGFVELKADALITPREIAVDEPMCVFGINSKGELMASTLRVVETRQKNGQPIYELTIFNKIPYGSSSSSGGMTQSVEIGGTCRAVFAAARSGEGKRFRLTTTISPPAKL